MMGKADIFGKGTNGVSTNGVSTDGRSSERERGSSERHKWVDLGKGQMESAVMGSLQSSCLLNGA